MRIKSGGARVTIETRRKPRERRPAVRAENYYSDAFEVTAVRPTRSAVTTWEVVQDFAEQGRARVAQDERRERAHQVEVGRLMGGLTAELVVELINHFVQRPTLQRSAPMVVLGVLTSALFVEFWCVLRGECSLGRAEDAEVLLEQFVSFIEETEGNPERRLAGTLYGG